MSLVLVGGVLAVPGSVFAADTRPNTCSGATTNSPHGSFIQEAVDSSTDADWYRFSLTSPKRVLITLGNLPANYRFELYGACSTRIALVDTSPGVAYEQYYPNLAAGTYRIKVTGVSGAFHATSKYALMFKPLAETVQVLSGSTWVDEFGYLNIAGEILNNTASNREYVQITATFYDSANRVVGAAYTFTDDEIVKSRARSPFKIVDEVPAGYHHYKLGVSSRVTSAAPVGGLALTGGVSYVEYGYRVTPGEVRNTNSFTALYVMVSATYYNKTGGVLNTEFTFTEPSDLAAGQTAPFEVVTDRWASLNRTRLSVSAIR